jgi:hypothetical protein
MKRNKHNPFHDLDKSGKGVITRRLFTRVGNETAK